MKKILVSLLALSVVGLGSVANAGTIGDALQNAAKDQGILLQDKSFCIGFFNVLQNEEKRRGTRVRLRARNNGARHDILDHLPALRH